MKLKTSAAVYFAVQGLAVFSWWAMLFLWPVSRTYFQLEPNSDTSLMAFWLADIFFLGIGSLVAGWLCFRDDQYKQIVSWFVTGAMSYSATYCFAFAMVTDRGWLGITLMFPAMIWCGVFSVGMTFEKGMFRKAAETSTEWILVKTFTQIVVVWSIILAVFPYLITIVEDKLGIIRIQFSPEFLRSMYLIVTSIRSSRFLKIELVSLGVSDVLHALSIFSYRVSIVYT